MKPAPLALLYASGSVVLASTALPLPVSTTNNDTPCVIRKNIFDTAVRSVAYTPVLLAAQDASNIPEHHHRHIELLNSSTDSEDGSSRQDEQITVSITARAVESLLSDSDPPANSKDTSSFFPRRSGNEDAWDFATARPRHHATKAKVSNDVNQGSRARAKISCETSAPTSQEAAELIAGLSTSATTTATSLSHASSPASLPFARLAERLTNRSIKLTTNNDPNNSTLQPRDLHDVFFMATQQGYYEIIVVISGYDAKFPVLEADAKTFCERISTEKPIPHATVDAAKKTSTSEKNKATSTSKAGKETRMEKSTEKTASADENTQKKQGKTTDAPDTTDKVKAKSGTVTREMDSLPSFVFPTAGSGTMAVSKKAHKTAVPEGNGDDVGAKVGTITGKRDVGSEAKMNAEEPSLASWYRAPFLWLKRRTVEGGGLEALVGKHEFSDLPSSRSKHLSATSYYKDKLTTYAHTSSQVILHKADKTSTSEDEEDTSTTSKLHSRTKSSLSSHKKTTTSSSDAPTKAPAPKPTTTLGVDRTPTPHHKSTPSPKPTSKASPDDDDSDMDSDDETFTKKPTASGTKVTSTSAPSPTTSGKSTASGEANSGAGADFHQSSLNWRVWVSAALGAFWLSGLWEARNHAFGHIEWEFANEMLRNKGLKRVATYEKTAAMGHA